MAITGKVRFSEGAIFAIILGVAVFLEGLLILVVNRDDQSRLTLHSVGAFGGLVAAVAAGLRLFRRRVTAVWLFWSAVAVFLGCLLIAFLRGIDDFDFAWVVLGTMSAVAAWLANYPDIIQRRLWEHRLKALVVVCSVYVAICLALAASFTYSALVSVNDPDASGFAVLFGLQALLFIAGTACLAAKKNYPGTRLMILGGILSVPIGIIPIVVAAIARRRWKRALRADEAMMRQAVASRATETEERSLPV